MNRFSDGEQIEHRESFIKDCMQKAWGAACHADWIQKSLDKLLAHYQSLKAQDRELDERMKTNADGVNGHTKENRNLRADLQKQRSGIDRQMRLIAQNVQQGATTMQKMLDSVDQNLLLADHAKGWSWIERAEPAKSTELEAAPEAVAE
jgi:chromosome segregation ATPase